MPEDQFERVKACRIEEIEAFLERRYSLASVGSDRDSDGDGRNQDAC
jgi:hypothetical protein